MRVIIVEGMLDEVLAVLEKTRQSHDSTGVSPVADAADEHHGNGAGEDEPDKGYSPLPLLSCRERSIIAHLMEGHSNKVIARDLNVAEPTVKSHVKNIFNKIGATNRTQAAMWGRTNLGESRLLPPPSSAVLSSRQQPSVAVEQWLKGKVEAGQGLDTDKASHLERRLDAPSFAQGELPASQQEDGEYPLDRSGRRK
jgi:DNA-binding CsgD family transcriptional regulator